MGIFQGAIGVLRGFATAAAIVLVLWVLGLMTHKGSTGFTAVGFGLADVFVWAIELIKAAFTGLANAAKSL